MAWRSWFLLKDEEEETAEEVEEKELMPADMVNLEATQEESLRLLGKRDGEERGDGESEGYEASIANTEDFERAMDVGEPEVSKAVIEAPPQPSAKEREEHRLHHANFEPWCEVCVQGQGKDKHHKRKEESKEHIIYSDYLFFNKDGHIIDKETGLKQKGLVTVLTAICKDSQFPFAIVVPAKGGNEYAIKALIAWIEEPRYSSQSLADGEMVNGLIAGKVRTWMAEINENYKIKASCDHYHYIFPWVVRHAAWTLARFHINKSRTTPYRIISGAEYTGELIPLGETVMAKFPRAVSTEMDQRHIWRQDQ